MLAMNSPIIYTTVCGAACVVSVLTLFCGFGLGTLLMPVFALFFPLDVAVAATALVHLANNVFKLGLVGRFARTRVLIPFLLGALPAAFVGALLLERLANNLPLATYSVGAKTCHVTAIGITIGVLMILFAVIEFLPNFSRWAVPPAWLPVGGAVSGFFGGLSGHQGALRSAFLIRCGLSKEEFVGTGAVSAVCIDAVRLAVYFSLTLGSKFGAVEQAGGLWLVAAACVAAFVGSFAGAKLIRKVTIGGVRVLVAILLTLTGVLLGAGLI